MARYTKKSKPKKKSNRDSLRASVTYSVDHSRPGIYTETKINDGDPSTYLHEIRRGPGPARPNLFRRETRRSVTAAEVGKKLDEALKKSKRK